MTWAIRSLALAAGAAALLSTQAAHAAPLNTRFVVDPLVSLSVFGTAQSRAAVCAAGSAAVAAGAAVAQTMAPGCPVLPVVAQPAAPPPPVTTSQLPPPPPMSGGGLGINPLYILGGLLVGGVLLWVLLDDKNNKRRAPISPA